MDALLEVMARLRDRERGCPWDVEQSFATIAPYTIEEAYEVAEAIERDDMAALQDELGDLLFQVVFHARMAEEAGGFAFDDVAQGAVDKMVRRHPHVFADAEVADAAAQTRHWEDLKARERAAAAASRGAAGQAASARGGGARGLPALLRALKRQKRAARVGFDWPSTRQVFEKFAEELAELHEEIETDGDRARMTDEIGDLLFVLVNLARHLEVDPEGALRHANAKFERRFRAVERAFDHDLAGVSLDAMEAAWQRAKKDED
ncbi:MAG: nucleoside triphosphate pyrophosphohydrolase [Kiloniellales bacterium]|nr:nucleoside triphosphate pyrophosphohydrolase [Kiloniellales bacterium]